MSETGSSASASPSSTTAVEIDNQEEAEVDSPSSPGTPNRSWSVDNETRLMGSWADEQVQNQQYAQDLDNDPALSRPFWEEHEWNSKQVYHRWNFTGFLAGTRGVLGSENTLANSGVPLYRDYQACNDFRDEAAHCREQPPADSMTVGENSDISTMIGRNVTQILLYQHANGFATVSTIIASLLIGFLFYSLLFQFFSDGLPQTAWPPVTGALMAIVIGRALASLLTWGLYGIVFIIFCVAILTGWLNGWVRWS